MRAALLVIALLCSLNGQAELVRLTQDGHFKQRPVWSPDGSRLMYALHKEDKIWLYSIDAKGNDPQRLTKRELPEYDGVWSPDGKRVAFVHVSQSGTQGDVDIYSIQTDGAGLTPLARTEGGLSHEEWPAWSPDGMRIAFTSTRPNNQEVFVADADGKNAKAVTSHLGHDAHPAWTPDSRSILFATDRWGGLEIASMQADGSDLRRLTNSPGFDDYPAVSPDGTFVAFVSNRDGNFEIYRMRIDGSDPVNLSRSSAVDTFPAWTMDGRGITFVSNRDRGFDLYTLQQ